jgi:hypothetical protein
MTLNSGPGRAAVRDELTALTDAFIRNGGEIIRGRRTGRVALACKLCRSHRYLDLGYYLKFYPRCLRCGGEMKPEW